MPNKRIWTDNDFQSINRIINLPASVAAGQPVIHEQLQAAIEGLDFKDNVRVAAQANVNLAAPGAVIDTVTMAIGDRFLPRNQTVLTEPGIYIWNGAAVAATRSLDANTFDEIESAVTMVDEGTDAGKGFRQTQVNGIIGTNNIIWASFGTGAVQATEATSGIAAVATQALTDAGVSDTTMVTPLKLKTSVFASRGFTVLFGDGTATQYDHAHNLNGEIEAKYYDVATGEIIEVRETKISANTHRTNLTPAPAVNAIRVVIQKVGG